MELQVSFRGKSLTVTGVGSATIVASLKERLEGLTAVPVANQKLILKGKALHDDTDTLEAAGVVVPSSSGTQQTPAAEPTLPERQQELRGAFTQKSKLLLVGSKPAEMEGALKGRGKGAVRNDLDGVVVPKGYKRVALNHRPGPSEFSPYRFERIETLPGLPEEETARKILESLAADPGVRAVLEKHRWTVGVLCELYPEGKVGISDTCLMGANQNKGMKILLRLRTDDLQGFRKILSIRKVLFHELAHNEFSDHDDNFYRLMRQVEREAAELDWTQQSGGRTVAGRQPVPRAEPAGLPGGGGGFVLVKEAFEGGSGRLGGDSSAFSQMFSARDLAGQAAVLRLTPEDQEVEDCCGQSKRNRDAAAAAIAATPAAAIPPVSSTIDAASASAADMSDLGSSDTSWTAMRTAREETAPPAPAVQGQRSAETVVASLVTQMSMVSDDIDDGVIGASPSGRAGGAAAGSSGSCGCCNGRRKGSSGMRAARDDGEGEEGEQAFPTATASSMDVVGEEGREVSVAPISSSSPSEMDKEPSPASSRLPETSVATAATARPSPLSRTSSPLDDLVAMGFPREAAREALSASGGSIPDAAYQLLTPGMMESESGNNGPAEVAAAAGGGVGGNREAGGLGIGDLARGGEVRLPRDVRLQRAADRIVEHDDKDRAAKCLDVLAAVFRNIMENPEEAKFRKIRRSNGKFKASVGAVAGGVELLLAAGFEERDGDQLELGRQDPGLIWLASGTVEAWQERLRLLSPT